jgi:hypothetical protein
VDLFASDGICELNAKLETPLKWEGSALLAVKMSKEYNNRWTCYLNELDSTTCSELKNNLKKYAQNHSQLPWITIEKIVNHMGSKLNDSQNRRP